MNEITKHTPGPWRVGDRKPYVEVWGPMRMNNYPILASMEHEPREANARLMAAAPDLLAACKDVESKIVDFEADRINWRPDDFLMRVRAAIAKAEGHPMPSPNHAKE